MASNFITTFWPKEEVKEVDVKKASRLIEEVCQGWFVCDSEDGKTRKFVIQGSVNFDSWRINLAFDPVVMLDPALGVKVRI